jgi:ABC-type dipeptide/oligopeptide/nickel transport system permease component
MAYCVRLLRGSLLETLEQDYVLMARAKGLRTGRVIASHALRNSVIPLITVMGPLLGYLISGTFVIETIFSVPGVARFYIASVLARDYTVVMGLTVMLAVIIILANLAVDVTHRALDPRLQEA